MSPRDDIAGFDPARMVPIRQLPEGSLTRAMPSRILMRGERIYDPLWRYVKKVDGTLYRGQKAAVRFGEFHMGLRAPGRIPAWVDFKTETLFLGRKLTIPFNALRGLMVAHGLMPTRVFPIFALLIRVDGCDDYIPLHQIVLDDTVTDLADFLSSRMRVPLGVASRPLRLLVRPGSSKIAHGEGETPLYEIRSLLTIRGPSGNTKVSIMKPGGNITLVDTPDPLGWMEKWGIILSELVSIVTKRVKSKYGRDL